MRPNHFRKMIPIALLAGIGLAGPVAAQVAPAYLLTDLGTLPGGTNSRAFGINASNEVVGYSEIAGGAHRATAWVGGVPNNLGVLAGDTASEARAVNAAGAIVGFSTNATPADQAVSFTIGGSPTNLNIIAGITQPSGAPALTHSRAENISPTGEIVGHAYSGDFNNLTTSDGIRGFYRNAAGTTVTRLDPTSGTTNYPVDGALSYGINATSQVFGQSDPGGATPGFRGSRWNAPSGTSSTPTTYPTGGGNPALTDYLGFNGNNANRLVGTASDLGSPATSQAFASDGSTTTLLNNLGTGTQGIANAINNGALTNVLVGGTNTDTSAGGNEHATAWNWSATAGALPSVVPIDLNTLLSSNPTGMTLIEALAINDAGFIVGFGNVGGAEHAFLLTPVPEPGTLALCGLAFGGAALRAYRRRRN